jgi:uncharacterized protein
MDALPELITERLDEIRALCVKYRVKHLTLFGSAANGLFNAKRSDIDLVVEFEWDNDPLERGRRYLGFWKELKKLFGRNVDLLEASTIHNPYLVQSIDASHRDIYDAA